MSSRRAIGYCNGRSRAEREPIGLRLDRERRRLVSGYVKGRIREGFALLRKGEFGDSEESGR
jgi:hypothetical protein